MARVQFFLVGGGAGLILSLTLATGPLRAESVDAIRKQRDQAEAHCKKAQTILEMYILDMDRKCNTVADCEARYLSVDSCASPVLVNKKAANSNEALVTAQKEVRAKCGELWSQRPACEPQPVTAACQRGTCVVAAPDIKPVDIKNLGRLKTGLVYNSCAPHDSPSLELILSSKTLSCKKGADHRKDSFVRANIWQPDFVAGPASGVEYGFTPGSQSGSASVCTDGSCDSLETFRIRITNSNRGKSLRGKFEGSIPNKGKIPQQEFNLIWCEGTSACG